jgi:hypothetical protein
VFVVGRGDEHEVRRRSAHFGAGHHQPEVRWRDVLAAGFQAVVHGCAETRLIAIQAYIDAVFHVLGERHFLNLACASPQQRHATHVVPFWRSGKANHRELAGPAAVSSDGQRAKKHRLG